MKKVNYYLSLNYTATKTSNTRRW